MKKRIHNWVLKAEVTIAAIAFIVSGMALDSLQWLPTIVCGVSLAFLALFAFANRKEMRRWI